MRELRVIGRSSTVMVGDVIEGDLRFTWRKDNVVEMTLAEKIFKKYLNKGWIAIGEASGNKTQIFTFDPDMEKIVLTPLLMGG